MRGKASGRFSFGRMLFFVEAADMLVERYECMATSKTLAVSQGFFLKFAMELLNATSI